ncbi:MAG: GNAT family N-acetyltransferase [Candidatus Rifleibacteriota bacterium]
MNNKLQLHEADASEVNALHKFELECFDRPEDQFPVKNLKHLIESPTSLTFLLKNNDGTIAGEVIGLLRNFKIPSGRIYKIAIDPRIQTRGLGSKLLGEMEKLFKQHGMEKSCAEVRQFNIASRSMFLKNGYSETGFLPNYYDNGENAIKYWKNL